MIGSQCREQARRVYHGPSLRPEREFRLNSIRQRAGFALVERNDSSQNRHDLQACLFETMFHRVA